ncbi:MAG: hypothetical protein ABSD59_20950 [Terracidiphilus sp.]|jgi:hypothetical protein
MRNVIIAAILAASSTGLALQAQNSSQPLELNRTGESIVLEPYAPNMACPANSVPVEL